MALIMCTLPLLVFEMISVINGFAKAGKIQLLKLLVKGHLHYVTYLLSKKSDENNFSLITFIFTVFDNII